MDRGFVGRTGEVNELRRALDAARVGQGALVVVAGEAGIGKTRLLEEVALDARQSGLAVSWSTCGPHGSPPMAPWAELLAQAGSELPPLPPDSDPDVSRMRLAAALTAVLRQLGPGPRLFVVDDVQWADELSLRLTATVASALRALPLLVLAASRTPMPPLVADIARPGSTIELGGLDEPALRDLVTALTGEAPAADVTATLLSRTGGNVLFAREVVRMLAARGGLDARATDYPLPSSVRAILRERVGDLPPSSRDIVGVLAATGQGAGPAIVAHAAGIHVDDALRALDDAIAADLVIEDRSGRFTVAHPLIQAAAYDALGVARRARLHERIGLAIEALGEPDAASVALLADHFLRAVPAGTAERAVRYARAAARDAMRLHASPAAVEILDRALTALDTAPAAGSRCDVLLELGDALIASGDLARARTTFLEAAALARAERPDQLAHAALGFAGRSGFEVPLFDRDQVRLLEEALIGLADDEIRLRALCSSRLSVALSLTGVDARRAELAETAVALARQANDAGALAQALAARCDARAGPEHVAGRDVDAREIIAIGAQLDDIETELLGRRLHLMTLLERGQLVAADVAIEAFARIARPLDQPRFDWYVALWRAARALYDRRFDDFERQHRVAADLGSDSGSQNAEVLVLGQRFFGLVMGGRAAEGLELLEASLAGERFAELGVQMAVTMAWSQALAGHADPARQIVDGIGDLDALPIDSEWLATLTQLAETVELIGGHRVERWVVEHLTPFADRWVIEGIGAAIRGPVDQWLRSGAGTAVNRMVRTGDVWSISFAGSTVSMRGSKGLRDLSQLFAWPGHEFAALDLASDGGATVVERGVGDALDATARRAYQQRIVDLEAALDDADARGDAARSAALAAERDALLVQLAGAFGLGGRARQTGSSAERARTAVTARIRDAIRRLADAHPELGRHLARSVRTGTFCTYDPDPPVTWQL